MTTKRWANWALKLHTLTAQSAAAVHVHGIRSMGLSGGPQTGLERGDGALYPSFGAFVSGGPRLQFSTSDLKTFFDECGVTGMLIDADGTHPGVVAYFQRMAQGGTRDAAAAGTHWSTTFKNGLVVPRTLEMSHQGAAILTAEAIPIKSGSDDPQTFDEAANLDAGINPTIDILWTVGDVDLSGTKITGVQRVSIDFGIDVFLEASDSDQYPTFVSVRSISPRITFSGGHIDDTSNIPEDGVYDATGTVFYAKKRAEGGTFVADGTAEHIKFTVGKCRWDWQGIGGDPKDLSVVVTPWDTPGGTAPLAINTASAIT